MNKRRLICVLGWEERFLLGFEREINELKIDVIDVLIYDEYQIVTKENLQKATTLSIQSKSQLEKHFIKYLNPVFTWKYLQSWIGKQINEGDEVWLDITTMPRETIWSLIFFLTQKGCVIHYIYWPPKEYSGQWLCKEPDKPRLLYKHSGVSEIQKDTALVIITGYDEERTAQLVFHYEPKLTLLGIQSGDQFGNLNRNILKVHEARCKGATKIEAFSIDAYQQEHGLAVLREVVSPLLNNYNVIISSIGPKPSAISTYQLYQEFNSIALTYVPTQVYNLNYSTGIEEAISGTYKYRL